MSRKAWIGLAFVVASAATLGTVLWGTPGVHTLGQRLVDHAGRRTLDLECRFEEEPVVQSGDPVYTIEDQAFALAGRVLRVEGAGPWIVKLEVDPVVLRRFDAETRAVAMKPGRGLGWILRTLMPPELRASFFRDLGAIWEREGPATLSALKDPAIALVGDVTNVLSDTLPGILERHRPALDAATRAIREEIYPRHLEPAVTEHLMPRIQERVEIAAAELGAAIWESIGWGDMWGVAWTGTKEKIGLAAESEVQARLADLLKQRALPVLKKRGPALLRAVLEAGQSSWRDPAIQQALDEATWAAMAHPEVQRCIRLVLNDWLVRNPPLLARLEEAFRSRDLREPLERMYAIAEPTLEKYLEEMLSRDDRKGMDHQLVRVLRGVVLKKDKRYIVLEPGDAGDAGIATGTVLSGVLGADL